MNPEGTAADIAEYHAWIGDPEGAIDWLRCSVAVSPTAQFLVSETATYDRIRQDPVFMAQFNELRDGIRARIAHAYTSGSTPSSRSPSRSW